MLRDERFASDEERCALIARLQARRRTLPPQEVARAGCQRESEVGA
jgi:hypothetical protein